MRETKKLDLRRDRPDSIPTLILRVNSLRAQLADGAASSEDREQIAELLCVWRCRLAELLAAPR
jgi:hypothetical protein